MDGVKVALVNRGMTMEAARKTGKSIGILFNEEESIGHM